MPSLYAFGQNWKGGLWPEEENGVCRACGGTIMSKLEGETGKRRGRITGVHAWMGTHSKGTRIILFRGLELGSGREYFPTKASMRRLTRACRFRIPGKTIIQPDGWDWTRKVQ